MTLLLLLFALVGDDLDQEIAYVAALRSRQLYRLAELQCTRLLEGHDLASDQRARVTVELSKTLAARALNSRPPERDQYWRRADSVLTAAMEQSESASSKILLQTQIALTTLQQAEWSRRETELRAKSSADWNVVQSQLRAAIKQLEAVEQKLLSSRNRADEPGLSPARAEELLRNARLQLARAYRNQAITYPDASSDRIRSLNNALRILQPLASDVVVDDLVWESRIERIRCHRLQGDLARARQLIEEAADAPERLLGQLAAEGIRLALAAGQPELAIPIAADANAGDPELELAHVAALVTLAERSREPETASDYQRQAVEIASNLGSRYGTYWGLRGEMLLVRLAETAGGDAKLLDTAAKTLLKQDEPEQAIQAFASAAEQAEKREEFGEAFDFWHKAATVAHQQEDFTEAIRRFRDVAIRYKDDPKSPTAHLLAVFDAAALYQRHATSGNQRLAAEALSQYEALLLEHLQLWPAAKTANQARIWFGRLAEAMRNWNAAIEAYRGVQADSDLRAEAYRRLSNLYQSQFQTRPTDASEVEDARDWLEARLREERDLNVASVLTAELARMALFVPPQDYQRAARMLQPRISDLAEREQQQELQALLVVAMAGLGKIQQARDHLTQASPLPMELLVDVLKGLQQIRDRTDADADADADAEIEALASEVVKLLQTYQARLQSAEQLLVEQAIADAKPTSEALGMYESLAAAHPQHRRIQLRYAELLATGRDRAARSRALQQWRLIARQSRPRSPEWFRAKLGVAQAHFDSGEHEKSREVIELLMTLYPEMGGAELSAKFESLLQRLQ